MKLVEAFEKTWAGPCRLGLRNPDMDYLLLRRNDGIDPEGECFWLIWTKKSSEGLTEEEAGDRTSGAGFGVPLFSLRDLQRDDWEVVALASDLVKNEYEPIRFSWYGRSIKPDWVLDSASRHLVHPDDLA